MMEPTDTPFENNISPCTAGAEIPKEQAKRHDFRLSPKQHDFHLSMLLPLRTTYNDEDDDDCSSATSLTLNWSTDSQESIELIESEKRGDGPNIWVRRVSGIEDSTPPHFVSWLRKEDNDDDNNNKNGMLTSPQAQALSFSPYCSAFTVLEGVLYEEQVVVNHEDDLENDEENKENQCPNSAAGIHEDIHDDEDRDGGVIGIVVPVSEDSDYLSSLRHCPSRFPSTLTRNSSFCDASIDLTACEFAEEDNLDDDEKSKVQPATAIVTNRSAWRSAFASGGGELPSVRVYADARDLYSSRRRMVLARQCWR